MAAPSLVCPPLAGRIVGSRGPRIPLLLAGLGITAGGALAVPATHSTDHAGSLLWRAYALFGLGFGFVNAPITDTAVAGLPRDQAGGAAAIAATSRQVGAALGIAVIGALIAAGARQAAWWTITGCGLIILALGAFSTRPRPNTGDPGSRESCRHHKPGPSGRTAPRAPMNVPSRTEVRARTDGTKHH